jgi:hypothetical protein
LTESDAQGLRTALSVAAEDGSLPLEALENVTGGFILTFTALVIIGVAAPIVATAAALAFSKAFNTASNGISQIKP